MKPSFDCLCHEHWPAGQSRRSLSEKATARTTRLRPPVSASQLKIERSQRGKTDATSAGPSACWPRGSARRLVGLPLGIGVSIQFALGLLFVAPAETAGRAAGSQYSESGDHLEALITTIFRRHAATSLTFSRSFNVRFPVWKRIAP